MADDLRLAQSVLLPLELGLSIKQTAIAIGRYGWIGASPDAANQFTADLIKSIKATYPLASPS